MHRAVLCRVLFRDRQAELVAKMRRYESVTDRAEIEQFQTDRFNDVWRYCLDSIPFYRAWREEYDLPTRIDHPSDLNSFPALTKKTLVTRSDEIFQCRAITDAYSTGGSTGEPARYPRGDGDTAPMYANMYLGRSWWGIRPFDPHVFLWGHSHLFGSGIRSRVAHVKRRVSDRALNITRLNAYDLTQRALASHYECFRRSDPVFVLGYASAVFKLARHIERGGLPLGTKDRLRAVILTSETVNDREIDTVARVFNTRVVIEYGAAETGVIACSRGGVRPLQVLWDSFACLPSSAGSVRVTTLGPRLFPLVNYDIGDVVEASDVEGGNALAFEAVLGRKQDVVTVTTREGEPLVLSAIMPVHILKNYEGILAVQFLQHDNSRVSVFLQADRRLDLKDVAAFFAREVRKDHAGFDSRSVDFQQVFDEQKTLAGKHLLFRE
jgi:phenylacetate-CoA ligase